MTKYDLIIVGAGPGGSATAFVASKLGLKVLLIDRFKFPRHKPCGGGLTPKTIALMYSLGIDPEPVIRNRCINVALVNWAGTHIINRDSNEPLIDITSRDEFDNYLLEASLNQGVEFIKDRIIGIEETHDYVKIKGLTNEYVGNFVVGADGANSIISQNIGNDIRKGRALALMTVARGHDFHIDTCIIDMTRIKWGYAWSFPRTRGEYDVGLGSLIWGNYREELKKYTRELSLSEGVIYGHPIPIKPKTNITSKRTLLVGDAGGFADPTTGEGIFYAMYTGALAALAIKKSRFSNPGTTYMRLINPLVKNLNLAYELSLTVYGLDTLIMSRYLGITAFSYEGTLRLISSIMSGRSWYIDALKSLTKPSLHVRLISNNGNF